ncbi:MAG: 50S ribosomal protein L5 [Flavobacteriaceae bacterium]|nr:50S ribosomal protein L5 [Flavobacteriaceae bacterium]
MEKYTPALKKKYNEQVIPALQKEFGYKNVMQVPRLEKIVVNQGIGQAIADKKILEYSLKEITTITGQKAQTALSTKDVSNFKLRKGMPIGTYVTLRKNNMYEFMEKLINIVLPRIRDFRGIGNKLDGKGNYTLGVKEQIIFPEISLDEVHKIMGMNITFVTTAKTDEEGLALLRELGLPFKK